MGPMIRRYSRSVANVITAQRHRQKCLEARELLPRLFPRISNTLRAQRAAGGLYHLYSEFKLLELASYLERIWPASVVEFGSGSTTAVFAEYAAKNPGSKVVSVDEDAAYSARTRASLDPRVRGYVTFVVSPRVVATRNGWEVCHYSPGFHESLKKGGIEMCYVDGPFNQSPADARRLLPCVDSVILLESGFEIQDFLFDYRISSVNYFCGSAFGPLFEQYLHPLVYADDAWIDGPIRHHSWLHRKRHTLCDPLESSPGGAKSDSDRLLSMDDS